jgi:predicted aspartyl protease
VPRNWASFPPFTLPVIALRVEDTIVRALADTGASQSLIDPRLVTQLGLVATGTRQIIGLGTTPLQVPLVTLDSVVIGRCPLQPFTAGIIDLTHLRIGIQLLLGINAFRGYRLQFDLAAGRVYLL